MVNATLRPLYPPKICPIPIVRWQFGIRVRSGAENLSPTRFRSPDVANRCIDCTLTYIRVSAIIRRASAVQGQHVATCRLYCELCQIMANNGYPNNQVQVELWLSNRKAGHSPALTTNRRPSPTNSRTWDIGQCCSKCRQFVKEQQRSNFLDPLFLFVDCDAVELGTDISNLGGNCCLHLQGRIVSPALLLTVTLTIHTQQIPP